MISGRLILLVFVVVLLLTVPSLLIHWLTSDTDASFEESMSPPVVHERPVRKKRIDRPVEFEETETEELTAPEPEWEEPKESMELVQAVRTGGILPPRVSGPLLAAVPGQAVKTELKMVVIGTLVINDGTDSRSSALVAVGGGASRPYFPGQEIGDGAGVKLVRVGQDRIEFLNHGRLEYATLRRSSAQGPAPDRREDRVDSTEDRISTPDVLVNDREEDLVPPVQEEKREEPPIEEQPPNEEEVR